MKRTLYIKHELAKKLQDNGFPQNGNGWYASKSMSENHEVYSGDQSLPVRQVIKDEVVYFPILSEVLDLLGDNFESIKLTPVAVREPQEAEHFTAKGGGKSAKGRNALTAVSRLWLKHKRNEA